MFSISDIRIGTGYDVHRLTTDRKCIIGGVEIPFEKGLLGHSDADVLIHAVVDALLGAAGMGDIGKIFPDTDPANKDISSRIILRSVAGQLRDAGWFVLNVDAVVICEKPKILPYAVLMRENIAEDISVDLGAVSVKGKTSEGLGFCGRGEGIAANASVLIAKK